MCGAAFFDSLLARGAPVVCQPHVQKFSVLVGCAWQLLLFCTHSGKKRNFGSESLSLSKETLLSEEVLDAVLTGDLTNIKFGIDISQEALKFETRASNMWDALLRAYRKP